jgi:hypothetical protein
MKLNYSVVVTSLVRDNEDHIDDLIAFLIKLNANFKHVTFLAAENNSKDNTYKQLRKKLKTLKPLGIKYKVYKFWFVKYKFPLRTPRLAYLHNFLISKIKDTDYLITVDSDGVLKDFNIEGLLSCFNYPIESWDMMGANSNIKYYDVWALRNKEIDFDCWDMVYHKTQMGMNREEAIQEFVSNHQTYIPENSDLIKVNSCFGGLGIYKFSSILDCFRDGKKAYCDCGSYNVKGKCIEEVCEHVSFHSQMIIKNNAKLFINPSMIVYSQNEHLF